MASFICHVVGGTKRFRLKRIVRPPAYREHCLTEDFRLNRSRESDAQAYALSALNETRNDDNATERTKNCLERRLKCWPKLLAAPCNAKDSTPAIAPRIEDYCSTAA